MLRDQGTRIAQGPPPCTTKWAIARRCDDLEQLNFSANGCAARFVIRVAHTAISPWSSPASARGSKGDRRGRRLWSRILLPAL